MCSRWSVPAVQDVLYVGVYLSSGFVAFDSGHEQLVVRRVVVPDRGDHGQGDRLGLHRPASRSAPDPAAAADRGVTRDRLCPPGRTAGEDPPDRFGRPRPQLEVLLCTACAVAFSAACPGFLVRQALNERLNKEIRRRTDVVGIFPDRDSLIRLVGAVLAEQHDEWTEGRRYLGLDVLSRSRMVLVTGEPTRPPPRPPRPSR